VHGGDVKSDPRDALSHRGFDGNGDAADAAIKA
jgi:hypothetical protein